MRCLCCSQQFAPQLDFLRLFLPCRTIPHYICGRCRRQFAEIEGPVCRFCFRPGKAGICRDCRVWQSIYGSKMLLNQAAFHYDSAMQDLLLTYKKLGDYELRLVLQELISNKLAQIKADAFVAVPTSPEHLRSRGFDNLRGIFADLVDLQPALVKKPGQRAQRGKSRQERLNAVQPFSLNRKFRGKLHGKVVLLDDVYTTGRTLYHARDKLVAGWPSINVKSFTICR